MSQQPEDGQGGMTLASGAEAVGEVGGPNASVGPTPYEQGVQDGRRQQEIADHEPLGHEDPIGDVAKAVAGGAEGAVDLAVDIGSELSDLVGTSSDAPDQVDAGESPDATVEPPDATVSGSPDAGAADPASGDDGGYCADPGYSQQDAGAY